MTIIFEAQNANEDFIKLVKSAAKLANVKIKTQRNKQEFYTLKDSPALKQIRKWEKENPQEAEKIKQELEMEMKNYYENYNHA